MPVGRLQAAPVWSCRFRRDGHDRHVPWPNCKLSCQINKAATSPILTAVSDRCRATLRERVNEHFDVADLSLPSVHRATIEDAAALGLPPCRLPRRCIRLPLRTFQSNAVA
jgi:hypothetical protein